MFSFITLVPKFGGPPTKKKSGGQKCKIMVDFGQLQASIIIRTAVPSTAAATSVPEIYYLILFPGLFCTFRVFIAFVTYTFLHTFVRSLRWMGTPL